MEAVRVPPSAWMTSPIRSRWSFSHHLHVAHRAQRTADEALYPPGCGLPVVRRLASRSMPRGGGAGSIRIGVIHACPILQKARTLFSRVRRCIPRGYRPSDEDRALRVGDVAPGDDGVAQGHLVPVVSSLIASSLLQFICRPSRARVMRPSKLTGLPGQQVRVEVGQM